MLDAFFQWLASQPTSVALHESLYVWPAIESVHVLTLALFVGFAAILDLRLLDVAFRDVPVSTLARRLLPWTGFGFVLMVVSGLLVFYANPVRFYHSIFFRAKMLMLVLAGVNAWIFHAGVWLSVDEWGPARPTPTAARLAGGASLVLWTAMIFAGRLIAYNWFDCGNVEARLIIWLSGC
jgi:hypothetical protein